MEARHSDSLEARDANAGQRLASVEDSAQQRIDAVQRELAERTARFENAEEEIGSAQAEASRLAAELEAVRAELETTAAQLAGERETASAARDRLDQLERQTSEATTGRAKLVAQLEAATKDNADLNRKLQEIEARRQLELADAEGRADIDDILRVTQERLAGQTEKLIAAEERVHTLEREVEIAGTRLEETEAELRQQQMTAAMRHLRGEDVEPSGDDVPVAPVAASAAPIEDRRSSTPFMQELSVDARKSLTRILGITQILKHKKDGKEQAQLVRQLTAHTRRLEHLVADLVDADRLMRADVELTIRRTDLEPLVQRVVEESGIEADHEVRMHTERVVVAVDQLRTEQVIAGLIRASGDRTPPKKAITVRLRATEGGALLTVEDPEPSSDASLSPVVQRFVEVQGGQAGVESREDGGSSFTVFLPDGAGRERPADRSAEAGSLHIVVEEPTSSASADGSMLVQELHRLSTAED
jgi:K+-sensing histidine kinase KdpD